MRELLAEYVNRAGGRIVLEIFDPKPDSEEEEWAERYGLIGAQMPQGSRLYHGMVVLSGGREAAIPFFDPRRERFLEFDISEAITRVGRDSEPTLGIISSLPVVGRSFNPGGQPDPDWAFVEDGRKKGKRGKGGKEEGGERRRGKKERVTLESPVTCGKQASRSDRSLVDTFRPANLRPGGGRAPALLGFRNTERSDEPAPKGVHAS